ncbi:MAG: nucleotidyltransferase domain-containing protein, partial [Thermoplasmatota archaeon]
IREDRKLFSANKYVTTGQIENLEYIIYVVPDAYAELESREKMQKTAEIIGKLNNILPERKFILMGPGRWGSRGDIKLGVPVQYRDINNTSILIEIAKEKGDYVPELSFGTHFFQDLVEANIRYLPLYPDEPGVIFNEEMFFRSKNRLIDFLPEHKNFEDVVRVIQVSDIAKGGTLSVIMDGEAGEALGYLKPPDHWQWRMKKVEELAEELDPDLYGVKDLYVVGSTKDGTARRNSDIDLIVHVEDNQNKKEDLRAWFKKKSKEISKENRERTGADTYDILDVHFITDKDFEKESSWATHITSRYKSARKIPLE